MGWSIAFLSILLSFWVKFMNRTDKSKEPDPIFWMKDNYPEMIVSFLSMIILLIIAGKIVYDEAKLIEDYPFITSLPIDLIAAALIGYLNNTLWYWVVSKGKKKLGMK